MESDKDPKLNTLLEENKQDTTKTSMSQLLNKCYSKRPLVIQLILHSSLLLYYFIYMIILFPNKFTVTLGSGKIIEIIPQINWKLIIMTLQIDSLVYPCLLVCLEAAYLRFGNFTKTAVKGLLYCSLFYETFLGYSLIEYILYVLNIGIVSYTLEALACRMFSIFVFILTYKFKDGAFLSSLPQAIVCLQSIPEVFFQTLTRYATPLLKVTEIDEKHHIHGILNNLVAKYNFDKNIVFLTGFGKNEPKEIENSGNFSYQTLFEDFLFLCKETVMEESVEGLKCAVYHEYGHLYYNHIKFSQLYIISVNLFMLAVICFAINSNLKSSKPKDKVRLALGLLSYSHLATEIFGFLDNIIGNYLEFVADDFSVSLQGDLSGIDAFLVSEKDISMNLQNPFEWILFYPPWFPYFDHPSVYHRHLRQVTRIK